MESIARAIRKSSGLNTYELYRHKFRAARVSKRFSGFFRSLLSARYQIRAPSQDAPAICR
jgi:hypothetical protein